MSSAQADDAFAKYVQQTGMATAAQVEAARKLQSSSPTPVTLGEALVQMGVITPTQRETVEKKLEAPGVGQLGSCRLLRKLGEGGMGAVYLAEDVTNARKVAVKVLPKRLAGDKEFLKRFLREAQAAAALDHENIVRGFEAAEEKGYHFYVMEFCEGESLGKRLKREGFLPHGRATDLVAQISRGLKYAHDRGFIHRDIKPDNVIVTPAGQAKILDLGLAKNLEDTQATFRTVTGAAIGTPHYIAPEQARGEKDVDGRADLYSLGATYYHLVTGQVPFSGTSVFEVINKHLTEQLPDPREIRREIPERVVQVIRRLMAKKPGDRYPATADLLNDLEQLLRDLPPLTVPIDPALSSVRGLARPASPPRSRRGLALAGGAAAAALAVIGLFAFSGDPEPAPAPPPPVAARPKADVPKPPPPEPLPAPVTDAPRTEPAKPPVNPAEASAKAGEPPKPPPEPPRPPPPEETVKPVAKPAEDPPKPEPAKGEPPPPPAPVGPVAPPDAAKIREAEKLFQKPLEADYAKKMPSDRGALAKKLLALDAQTDPAQEFVRLRDARDFAAQGADAATALLAVEKLAATFAVDTLGMKADALAAVTNVKTQDAAADHARACLATIEEAVAADRYDVAAKLAARAEASAKTAKDDDLLASIKAANKDAAAFASEFQSLRGYKETIEKRPDDAASNLNLGKFRAFTKGDWDRGLPMLLKGSDLVLRSLAEKEIAKPEADAARIDLCEGWLAQADKEKSNALRKETLLERARSWFEKVEGELTETDRSRLSKRLGTAPAAAAPARKPAAGPAPAVRPGPQAGTLDLMDLVDPAKDTVNGTWTREGRTLVSPQGGDNVNRGSARIWIPYAPPDEYELFLEVERRSGDEDLVVGLVGPSGRPFAFGLDGWGAQKASGIFTGRWEQAPNSATHVLGASGRYQIGIHVRKAGGFRVRVQNREVLAVPNYDNLSIPAHVQIPGRAGGLIIGGVRSSFVIHSIVLKPMSKEKGSVIPR